MTAPITWRYDLPSIKAEGWAIIMLTSDGFFAAVSDFGNYAFRWTSWGWTSWGPRDFREFMLGIGDDYLLSKIASQVYDGAATESAIRRDILSERRKRNMDRERAREEWDLLDVHDLSHEFGFYEWAGETSFDDAPSYACHRYDGDARSFAEKTMPRLREAIRAQMAADAAPVAASATGGAS